MSGIRNPLASARCPAPDTRHPISGRLWKGIAAGFLALAVAEPFAFNFFIQQQLFRRPAVNTRWGRDFYPVVALDPARDLQRQFRDYFFVKENVGIINWYCPLDLPRAAVPRFHVLADRTDLFSGGEVGKTALPTGFTRTRNPDYLGEAHCLRPTNTAKVLELTPNRLTIEVTIDTPDTLVINQNYDPRWRTDAGALTWVPMDRPAYLHLGLADPKASPVTYDRTDREFRQLAVRLDEPGRHVVTLRYRPWDAYLGALISGPAWLACLGVLVVAAIRRSRRATRTLSEDQP